MSIVNLKSESIKHFSRESAIQLAEIYYPGDQQVLAASQVLSVEHFLRLFITVHGMKPIGTWQTHTYAEYVDSATGLSHFFLIPMQQQTRTEKTPFIRFEQNALWIDQWQTSIRPQAIPYTTPFWYFHYNPNRTTTPYYSMTLNLSPSCLEKCVLCAGAKTGRVNNGMDDTLAAENVANRIFTQHPAAKQQLEEVAIVTGCFADFDEMTGHLANVKQAINLHAQPARYRVLEHNVVTAEQFSLVVGELGYEVFITLECFDQEIRNIALNGKVGRKGRNSQEFLEIIRNYAHYLEAHPEVKQPLIRVTYLLGLDDLATTEYFFQQLAALNQTLKHTTVLPWLSIFTPYNQAMQRIQQQEFGLPFLLKAMELCQQYFSKELLFSESGTTAEGYARGFF